MIQLSSVYYNSIEVGKLFQVIELQGEYEPWWFFDDWKKQISRIKTFEIFDEALNEYQQTFKNLQNKYPNYQKKKDYLSAFWDESQNRYCLECDDDIQVFHSVMLVREFKVIE